MGNLLLLLSLKDFIHGMMTELKIFWIILFTLIFLMKLNKHGRFKEIWLNEDGLWSKYKKRFKKENQILMNLLCHKKKLLMQLFKSYQQSLPKMILENI